MSCLWEHELGAPAFTCNPTEVLAPGGVDPHGQLLSLEMGPAPCEVMAQESSGALLMSFGRNVEKKQYYATYVR